MSHKTDAISHCSHSCFDKCRRAVSVTQGHHNKLTEPHLKTHRNTYIYQMARQKRLLKFLLTRWGPNFQGECVYTTDRIIFSARNSAWIHSQSLKGSYQEESNSAWSFEILKKIVNCTILYVLELYISIKNTQKKQQQHTYWH